MFRKLKKKIKSNNYDLVICDIKMPKKDGIDVLNFTKKYNEETKILYVKTS